MDSEGITRVREIVSDGLAYFGQVEWSLCSAG